MVSLVNRLNSMRERIELEVVVVVNYGPNVVLGRIQRRRIVQKEEGTSSNMVGITCPPWSE
jgi:hypothetical protein